MDYDQALRIACFYGTVVEVESLLFMEAAASSVAFNQRDRGSTFNASVDSAVRDGINALLNESSDCDASGSDTSRKSVALAKEAAVAWGAAGTLRSSTSTGTGWTSGGKSSSKGGDGGFQSSSVESDRGDDGRQQQPARDFHESCGVRVRQVLGFARDGENVKEAGCKSEDDDTESFILPSLVSIENDLIREGDAGIFGVETSVPTRAAVAVRRWGQRVTGGGGGGGGGGRAWAKKESAQRVAGGGGGGRAWARKESAAAMNKRAGLGVVKVSARATFAGVVKWATSPKGRRTEEGFAG